MPPGSPSPPSLTPSPSPTAPPGKGSGVLDLALSRKVGRWNIVEGKLTVDGGPTIVLEPGEIGSGESS